MGSGNNDVTLSGFSQTWCFGKSLTVYVFGLPGLCIIPAYNTHVFMDSCTSPTFVKTEIKRILWWAFGFNEFSVFSYFFGAGHMITMLRYHFRIAKLKYYGLIYHNCNLFVQLRQQESLQVWHCRRLNLLFFYQRWHLQRMGMALGRTHFGSGFLFSDWFSETFGVRVDFLGS